MSLGRAGLQACVPGKARNRFRRWGPWPQRRKHNKLVLANAGLKARSTREVVRVLEGRQISLLAQSGMASAGNWKRGAARAPLSLSGLL